MSLASVTGLSLDDFPQARHLHRFVDTGEVARYDHGKPVKRRECSCGEVSQ